MSNSGNATVINDRYEIHKRIGRGGMADVFLSQDLLLDRQVAIKVLFPEYAVDPNFVERFRREAQAAANLSHPNIVNVYDWGKYESTYFIAMEYVQGRTLAEILKTNDRLTPRQAAEIASEVAAALGFAHEGGLAHRDIKPANILIGANGQVKVADFGIARAMNSATETNLTQAGSVMGTAAYFSPEQAQGGQPDPRSDLYSLGIVMYEMVAGRPPFQGDNAVSIAYKQVHSPPQPLNQLVDGVPRPFEAIVAKLLAKNPTLRYPSANALRDDLRRFRGGEQVQALVSAAAQPPGRPPAADDQTTVMPPRPVTTTPSARDDSQSVPGAPTTVLGSERPPEDLDQYPPGASPEARYYQDSTSRTGWYALAAFIALIALAAGGVLLFQSLANDGSDTSGQVLGDYYGLPYQQVIDELTELGFAPQAVPEPDPTQAEGVVYRTDPEPGEVVPAGGAVQVIYNPTQASVEVPNVDGRTLEEAIRLLTAEGFTVSEAPIVEESDQYDEPNIVVRSDPPGGSSVPLTNVIQLYVTGEPQQVFVPPTILGQTLEDAKLTLASEPYNLLVEEEFVEDDAVPEGQVVSSDPAPNEPVEPGDTIVLSVSSGPGEVVVPPLVGQTEGQARNTLRDLDLQVDVTTRELDPGSADDGRVVEQAPLAGNSVGRGTTVSIVVGQASAPTTTSTTTTTTTPTTTSSTTSTTTSTTSTTTSTTSTTTTVAP